VLSSRLKLRAHRLTHSSQQPFLCSHCNKRFKEKRALVKHIKLKQHGGAAPAAAAAASAAAADGGDQFAVEDGELVQLPPSSDQDGEQPDSTESKDDLAE
jgi:hypothetical protein